MGSTKTDIIYSKEVNNTGGDINYAFYGNEDDLVDNGEISPSEAAFMVGEKQAQYPDEETEEDE